MGRSKENVKAFLDALPNDGYQVWEMPSDFQSRQRQYRELDYFHGKTWLFGFLHSYGGTTMLHGDLADLIRRGQEVAGDPRADKCQGMGIQPEALRHNYVVFDLLSRVGWDPRRLELDSFLADYTTRRYGKESASKMVECFKELTASVYGEPGSQCPLYMIRVRNQHLNPQNPYGVGQAKRFLPHLENALEMALEESNRLQSSPLYQHDLIDIARQFLSDMFNLHVALLAEAWQANDKEAFDREAKALRQILTDQEALLSSSDYFCLAPLLAKAQALPGAPADYDERTRDILTVWAGRILDYAHRDYYELVHFYYRPRVEAMIEHARSRLGKQATMVSDEQLAPIYHEIEQAWVKKPFQVAEGEKYAEGPVQAVAEILAGHRQEVREKREPAATEARLRRTRRTPRSTNRAFLRKKEPSRPGSPVRGPSLNSRPASVAFVAPEAKSGARHDWRKPAPEPRPTAATPNRARGRILRSPVPSPLETGRPPAAGWHGHWKRQKLDAAP